MSKAAEESTTQNEETEKPAEEIEKPEEEPEKEEIPKTPDPQKRTKTEKKISTYYKIDNETITRQRPFCERCGSGYFMADHGNRYTCGHCGFTRYKQTQ